MDILQFIDKFNFFDKTEIEKVKILGYYDIKYKSRDSFSLQDISLYFNELGLSSPNVSRLRDNIKKSRDFIKGSLDNTYRITPKVISSIDEYLLRNNLTQEVISLDTVLPKSLYDVNRGYIIALAKQINACYENNIFDGCAVLMRRLLEILLIHSYENLGISSNIKGPDGNYYLLEGIASDARNNPTLNLSRTTKPLLETFRSLGNFSAHRIQYTCRHEYIEQVILDYRAAIEELLYKSGLKI